MKLPLRLCTLFFLAIGLFPTQAQTVVPLELNASLKNQMDLVESPVGTYDILTQGIDPWIQTKPIATPYNQNQVYVITFDYLAPAGLDNLQIFYGAPLSVARLVDFGSLTASSNFTTFKAFMKYEAPIWSGYYDRFRFDFGKAAGQSLQLKNLQIRAALPGEVIPMELDITRRNQLTATEPSPGNYSLSTLAGGDPYIFSKPVTTSYNYNKTFVIAFDYVAPSGLDDLEIFYGTPVSATRKASLGSLPAATVPRKFSTLLKITAPLWNTSYESYRFDIGKLAGQNISISNLVLREPTNLEKKALEIKEQVMIPLNPARTSANLTAVEISPGTYQLSTTGNDPWIQSAPISDLYDINQSYIMSFEYKSEKAYNDLEVFYGPPIAGTQTLSAGPLAAAADWTTFTINPKLLVENFQAENWTLFRFDFGKNENETKAIFVRNLVIRKPTPAELLVEQTSDRFLSRANNQKFLTYLNAAYTDSVKPVTIGQTKITLKGNVSSGEESLFLAEIEPHQYGFDQTTFTFVAPVLVENGAFSLELERYLPKEGRAYDRLYSRWALVKKTSDDSYVLASHAQWAGDISAIAANNLAEEKASTIKGLDGLSPGTMANFEDLTDLDVKSMKLNILLNGVYSPNPSSMSHTFNGKTYNINPVFVQGFDTRIKRLTDNGIKAAFVLLIPINIGNEQIRKLFVHPDASKGLYSMANVATEEGVEYYTAMVDFLAQRYSRPDNLYGRLDQWIIHNEVDAHTEWTHAGDKPVELYTEIYDRSMRLVHYTIRKHNPTAKVFASFTKHFNSKPGSQENFRSKDILSVLGKLSKKEGDYEWNIGWHSYPTNLFNPLVWNDAPAQTQFNFNTPQITPKNLEVIDAYVRQKEVLYNGKKVRTVLLSENGFSSNTARNANANETTQAAALAYFWKKANNRLPSIENIQLHRWVDNPNEAGLEFGLWTVKPGTVEGFEKKKQGWFVWEAAGTPREDAVFEPYKSVIGISDWSEIFQDVPTEVTPHTVTLQVEGCTESLNELLVSFNGELKVPQADGSVSFYNVASNVPQPYEVRKNGVLLTADVIQINGNLALTINLKAFEAITAKGISPSEIKVEWIPALASTQGYVVEARIEGSSFAEVGRVGAEQINFIHAGLTPGIRYYYRVAGLLGQGNLSCYSEEVSAIAPFIVVEYADGDKEKTSNNKIRPHLKLRNASEHSIDLSRATIRYWFTAEETQGLIFKAEQAGGLDKDDLKGEFVSLAPIREKADRYLQLSFGAQAQIPANGSTGEIRIKIEKTNPSPFNELNDYSYAEKMDFQETKSVTVYWNGELIWGEEPKDALQSQPLSLAKVISVYPNPSQGNITMQWSGNIESAAEFWLYDYHNLPHPATIHQIDGELLLIQLPQVPNGLYILRGNINGRTVTHRIIVE